MAIAVTHQARAKLKPAAVPGFPRMSSQDSCQLPATLIAHFESYIATPGFQKAIKSEHSWMSCLLHDSLHWIISGIGIIKGITLINLCSQDAP